MFRGDSYHTPANKRRGFWDFLLCGNRHNFYMRSGWILGRAGIRSRLGLLTPASQVKYSNKILRLLESCGAKFHIEGLENIRAVEGSEPVVLMGNHMSMLETSLFHAMLRPHFDFTYVIKEDLLTVPFFGHIMRALEAIPVGRTNPRDDLKTLLTEGKERLGRGKSVIIFPQGTRNREFRKEEFNSIGFKLARHAGVRVLPFALCTDFIGINGFDKLNPENPILFHFFPVMTIEGNGAAEHKAVTEMIADKLAEWKMKKENGEL